LPLRYHRSLSCSRCCNRRGAVNYILAAARCDTIRLALIPPPVPLSPTIIAAATAVVVNTIRRYYSNTIVTDVIANAIVAIINNRASVATIAIKF